jgi:hypothetical protein
MNPLQRPESLGHVFQVGRKEVKVKLSWGFPKSWPRQKLNGWKLVWGKRLDHPNGGLYPAIRPYPLLNRETAVSQVNIELICMIV